MNKQNTFTAFLLYAIILLLSSPISAQDIDVRISWDGSSYQELKSYIITEGNATSRTAYYPRIKRLEDGSLFMVFMNAQTGYNIFGRKSTDDGKTWGNAQLIRKQYSEASQTSATDKIVFACPDFIELGNGEILLAYQWRYNNAYASVTYTNISCGIEVIRSYDYGETWEEPNRMYYGRNWEPSFILLPSGELQMLITDSHEVTAAATSRPCVSLLRSFDKGETWQGKDVCTYEDAEVLSRIVDANGTYDGMPIGKNLADNKGIAYACESWGVGETPWIVYSTSEKNWYYNDFDFATGGPGSDRRWLIHEDFVGHAPYLEVLPTGNVIVQSNGKYKGTSRMWTFIGDNEAKNFSHASSPHTSWWGSISYIGNDEVISTGNFEYSVGSLSYMGLKVIKGKLNYAKTVYKSPISLQSLSSFDRSKNKDWFIGQSEETTALAYVNFGFSDDSFDYTVHWFDSCIVAYTPINADAVVFRMNRTTKTGDSENYQMAVNGLGDFSLDKKIGYTWTAQDASSVKDITVNVDGTVNDGSDTDLGYAVKVSIPWELIGGFPSEDDVFRIHLRQRYKDAVSGTPAASISSMPGEDSDDSSTWLKINFDFNDPSGISTLNNESDLIAISGNDIQVKNPALIDDISIYNIFGQKMLHISPVEKLHTVNFATGIYVISCKNKAGKIETKKAFFK